MPRAADNRMNASWIRYLPAPVRGYLDSRSNLQKIVANACWLMGDKLLRMGLGLIVGLLIARYLGPGQFGSYSYALAFVALASVFATGGLDQVVVRHLVLSPTQGREILGTAFIIKLAGALFSLALASGAILLVRPDDSLMRWMVAILAAGVLFQAADVVDYWFQAQVKSKYTVFARNSAFIVFAGVKLTLILLQAPLIAFAWAAALELALGAGILIYYYQRMGHRVAEWRFRILRMQTIFRESWPLLLSSIAVVLYMRIDQVMLGEMLGSEAVGIYTAATRITELWYLVPIVIVSSVYPSIIDAKRNPDFYYDRMQKLTTIMAVAAYIIVIPITLLSTDIVVLLFGEPYRQAGPVLAIHIWATIFVFFGVLQTAWNVNEGLQKIVLWRTVAGAAINVALNVVLIPPYGPYGAALATLISYVGVGYLSNLTSSRTIIMFRMQSRALLLRWTPPHTKA